jgi:Holliday junction resolvase
LSYIRQINNYKYERVLLRRLTNRNWTADRLSISNREMTCIIAVNNIEAISLAIAPKLESSDDIRVLPSQIFQCLRIRQMFRYYKTKHAILAFRFLVKNGKYTSRDKLKPTEYYKIVDGLLKFDSIPLIRCTRDGRTSVMREGKWINKALPDYVMPFMISDKDEGINND